MANIDLKLEIVVIPVSDVDRSKEFYAQLGWRLDADFDSGNDFRVIQFTPPGPAVPSSSARTSPPHRRARPRGRSVGNSVSPRC
ncbi:MAG: VOC family protein [Mycobacterium sp.]